METIIRKEVTFEILKIRLLRSKGQEWFEITVKKDDEYGTREMIIREGDVLKAIFEYGEEDPCSKKQSRTKTHSTTKKLRKSFSSIFRRPRS